jgi:hypothetical protein
MRKLTKILPIGSTEMIADGIKRGFANFDEMLRKGTKDYRRLELSLLDSLP